MRKREEEEEEEEEEEFVFKEYYRERACGCARK